MCLANVLTLRLLTTARAGPHDVPNSVPRQLQLTRDGLDLPALDKIRPPNLANRVHRDHPLPPFVPTHALGAIIRDQGEGQNCSSITPELGSCLDGPCCARVKLAMVHQPSAVMSTACSSRDVLAGQDEIRGSAPNQNSALDGALTPWGVPIPGRGRFVISSLHPGAFVDRTVLLQAGRAM